MDKRQTRTRNGRQQDLRTNVGVQLSDRNKKAANCGHMTSLLPLCGVKQGRDCPQCRLCTVSPAPSVKAACACVISFTERSFTEFVISMNILILESCLMDAISAQRCRILVNVKPKQHLHK